MLFISCNKHNICTCTTINGNVTEIKQTQYKYLTKKQIESTCLKNTTHITGTVTTTENCTIN